MEGRQLVLPQGKHTSIHHRERERVLGYSLHIVKVPEVVQREMSCGDKAIFVVEMASKVT